MMRTEDDVRQALRQREREAARADEVLPRLQLDEPGPRHSRGRTYVLATAACIAVVGVVVATMLVAGRHGDRSGTTPSPSPTPKVTSSIRMPLGPKFEFSFEVGQLPAGYVALNQQIGGIELQGMQLRGATPQWVEIGCPIQGTAANVPSPPPLMVPAACESGRSGHSAADQYVLAAVVGAFGKGQFDPSVLRNATAVNVNGAPGVITEGMVTGSIEWSGLAIGIPSNWAAQTALAWQYAPDSWALVAGPGTRDLMTAIARATRVGGAHRALVPFSVGYLPASLNQRRGISVSLAAHRALVSFGSGPSGPHDHALYISAAANSTGSPRDQVALTVDGRAARYSPGQSTLTMDCGRDCELTITWLDSGTPLTKAELIKVAEHITVAPSLTDTSTWYDASSALPH
jgi:hypothetical protein